MNFQVSTATLVLIPYKMVGKVGLEPTQTESADLQSTAIAAMRFPDKKEAVIMIKNTLPRTVKSAAKQLWLPF